MNNKIILLPHCQTEQIHIQQALSKCIMDVFQIYLYKSLLPFVKSGKSHLFFLFIISFLSQSQNTASIFNICGDFYPADSHHFIPDISNL